MKILIIDDNDYKYENIKNILEKVVDNPEIDWRKSRNSGLRTLVKHNLINKENEPYDLLITDNIMPMFDNEYKLEPFGEDIISEARRLCDENLTIVFCSSEEVEECAFDYKIKYDSRVYLDDKFRDIVYSVSLKKNRIKKLIK